MVIDTFDWGEPVDYFWQCPRCLIYFDEHGECMNCGGRLKIVVEQIAE